ncbi:MAG: hypothetical protein ACRYFS_08500 [Janthinobacterium lividum]
MPPALRRSAARSTLVSHLGVHHGDRSFLLVRERTGTLTSGECLALHGTFDLLVQDRLHLTWLSLSHSILPLLLDLRGVSALDESFLARLLKIQRELASLRPVTFQIAEDGPVMLLIRRLGLEDRFGLELTKPLPQKRSAALAFPVSRTSDEKSVNCEFAAN